MSSLAELDRDKVVDLDFTSAEFRRNAHRLVADGDRKSTRLNSSHSS